MSDVPDGVAKVKYLIGSRLGVQIYLLSDAGRLPCLIFSTKFVKNRSLTGQPVVS